MKILRMAALALVLSVFAAPLTAQMLGSDGEKFISAVREADGTKVMDLLNARGSTVINYRDYKGDTALVIVARRRGDWLGFLLGKGADPNVGDAKGDTPLIIVSRIGYYEGVRILLGARAKVDLANKLGETALIVAVQGRQPQTVRLLLAAGANPDKADHAAGYSARDYAKQDRRSTELLKLIETVKPTAKTSVGPSIK